MRKKFKCGDIVTLEGCVASRRDENYGIKGRVIGYVYNPFENCPIVEVFTPFKFGGVPRNIVSHLADYWWERVDESKECYCESLL